MIRAPYLGWDPHNCLLYALAMRWKYGGRIIRRKSPRGWWSHFWWTFDGIDEYEYTPIHPVLGMWFPPPIYEGKVQVTNVKPLLLMHHERIECPDCERVIASCACPVNECRRLTHVVRCLKCAHKRG
jgi:hypothetical protein